MKVGIIGYGPTLYGTTQAAIAAMEEKGIEVIHIGPEEVSERGIHMTHAVVDELKSIREIDPFMLQMPFQPPLTRRERRKLNRKKK
jgi:hypothetical protein